MQLRQFQEREDSKAVWLTDPELTRLMFAETEEVGWTYVSAHDLRRSWATMLIQAEIEPLLVMDWGGWSDFEVFKDHYMSISSPEFQASERRKVPWL